VGIAGVKRCTKQQKASNLQLLKQSLSLATTSFLRFYTYVDLGKYATREEQHQSKVGLQLKTNSAPSFIGSILQAP
jgi:hypothetical protein